MPSSPLTTAPSAVLELYLVDEPRARPQWIAALLDDADRERAAAIRHEGARAEFVTGRALLRTALSRTVDGALAPHAWRFAPNPWGRPELAGALPEGARDLRFNLSHTRGLVAVALARAPVAELGVDVETVHRRTRTDALAERYFAPAELEALRALPSTSARRERFFALWTLKEAYIKARGRGLAIPLREFAFALEAPGTLALDFAPQHDEQRPARWRCGLFEPAPGHRLALAAALSEASSARLEVRAYRARGERLEVDAHALRPLAVSAPLAAATPLTE